MFLFFTPPCLKGTGIVVMLEIYSDYTSNYIADNYFQLADGMDLRTFL